ncbi:MAG: hypothetical protein AB3N21_20930 [Ruegeria sp.]|uniref:hypothetical protein n=1 Tax=Ruegeria sp. TaxID=1879320 RepID=UPI00349E870C
MGDKAIDLVHKKKTKRMDFRIDGKKGQVWVRQTWNYVYVTKKKASKWTPKEKKDFHVAIEKTIRKAWNGKFVLTVKGKSEFAAHYKGKTLTVHFDVDPVSSGAHWTVTAAKIPKGDFHGSKVNWGKQTIELDTEDMNPAKKKGAPKGVTQDPAAHEFGHAIGNATGSPAGHADEYKKTSAYKHHKKSIMNVGMKVKKRHADYLVIELNKIIPDTTFVVKSVK